MASRLDALIGQLHALEADALLVEAGNSLFLKKGDEHLPLVNAKLTNEHVAELLRPAAPPDARLSIDRSESVDFDYVSPTGPVHVEVATSNGKMFARITRESFRDSMDSVSDGTPFGGLAPPTDALAPPSDDALEIGTPVATTTSTTTSAPATKAPAERAGAAALAAALIPAPVNGRPAIEEWFEAFLKTGGSDLHLTSGLPAMIRSVDGEIVQLPGVPAAEPWELEQLLLQIMPPGAREEWEQTRDCDFAYDLQKARLRCNVFCDIRGPAATFRRIPNALLTVEQLGLPPAVIELCRLKKGLVLVTGPTGAGKSTTLAAMIDWINQNRQEHIVTIEDPIEFVHTPKRCLIHQRQVGVHTRTFSRALRAALREDPDIILVGELRDLETIALAVEVAETGHLVFGTLHTTTAHSTVDRIVDQFDAEKQEQVRQMVAESLKGVISQTLCKRTDGGRALALEVLLVNGAVANMIREKKTFQIPSVLQTSKALGMRALNDSLMELVKSGAVDPWEAIDRSIDKGGMKRDLVAAKLIPPD
jgi:twitching motility protein PilT